SARTRREAKRAAQTRLLHYTHTQDRSTCLLLSPRWPPPPVLQTVHRAAASFIPRASPSRCSRVRDAAGGPAADSGDGGPAGRGLPGGGRLHRPGLRARPRHRRRPDRRRLEGGAQARAGAGVIISHRRAAPRARFVLQRLPT
ncbi:Protein ECERIFERUM 3, partial [Zea mays]